MFILVHLITQRFTVTRMDLNNGPTRRVITLFRETHVSLHLVQSIAILRTLRPRLHLRHVGTRTPADSMRSKFRFAASLSSIKNSSNSSAKFRRLLRNFYSLRPTRMKLESSLLEFRVKTIASIVRTPDVRFSPPFLSAD